MSEDWRGLYGEGWQGEIVPEAFSHPAKFTRGLIRRIYQHAVEEGWLKPGDCVIDPFGGVALGGLDAMTYGLNWVGVELEQRFVSLGNANIALWNARYGGKLPKWGKAILLQGDSRNLCDVLGAACDGAISSPPYSHPAKGIDADEMDVKMRHINSARLGRGDIQGGIGRSGRLGASILAPDGYGSTPGNLGNMKAGEFGAAISSSPYSEARIGQESGQEQCGRNDAYSTTPGQLGSMKAGDHDLACATGEGAAGEGLDGAVSSPPWIGTNSEFDSNTGARQAIGDSADKTVQYAESRVDLRNEYAYMSPEWIEHRKETARQQNLSRLPNEAKDPDYPTFWSEARKIVEQTYQALRPGAHAIWVVKAFVKDKKIVPFPDQWRQLCEAVGFKTIHEHRAWLVEERGTQYDLEGNGHHKIVQRKSFFRLLAEQKGSPRIDWECVLCTVKPTD